jgi:hypothetical protein
MNQILKNLCENFAYLAPFAVINTYSLGDDINILRMVYLLISPDK